MIRTARYLSRIVWQYLLGLAGLAAALIAFQALITPQEDLSHAAGYVTGLAFSMALMLPILLQLSMVSVYVPLGLSMGVTRRGLFGGLQIAKLHLAIGLAALFELVQIAAGAVFGAAPVFHGAGLAGVCMAILLCAALGETCSIVGMRFGRKGLVVIAVLTGVLAGTAGGVIGFTAASDALDGLFEAAMRFLQNTPLLGAATLAATGLLAGIDWLACRRITVQ